jgi:hypothetical protein
MVSRYICLRKRYPMQTNSDILAIIRVRALADLRHIHTPIRNEARMYKTNNFMITSIFRNQTHDPGWRRHFGPVQHSTQYRTCAQVIQRCCHRSPRGNALTYDQ